ncbi:hypothetical protein [Psychrobacillus sp. FSL H8-0487]|uniref:hypothetical protein n=1 Tax=Psychrobacillus sp. FSL H8-0487 TaxID=2921391 RepID=UPI0030F770E2
MNKQEENKDIVQRLLPNDKLYEVLKDSPEEEILYSAQYFSEIVEKQHYSTIQVAEWFGINDGQIRYYIKPFHEYIFEGEDDDPSTPTAIRLGFTAILKLHMIIILKDRYRIGGIKKLLGIDGQGYVVRRNEKVSAEREIVASADVDVHEQLNTLNAMMETVINSGLFKQTEEGLKPSINLQDITEQIEQIRRESQQKLEDSIKTMLPAPKNEQQVRAERTDQMIAATRLRLKLEEEAIAEWSKLPEEKRTKLTGIFFKKREEDLVERDKFIRDYLLQKLDDPKTIENI